MTELRVVPQDDGTVLTIAMVANYSSKGPIFPPEFTALKPEVRRTYRTPAEVARWLQRQIGEIQAAGPMSHGL